MDMASKLFTFTLHLHYIYMPNQAKDKPSEHRRTLSSLLQCYDQLTGQQVLASRSCRSTLQ